MSTPRSGPVWAERSGSWRRYRQERARLQEVDPPTVGRGRRDPRKTEGDDVTSFFAGRTGTGAASGPKATTRSARRGRARGAGLLWCLRIGRGTLVLALLLCGRGAYATAADVESAGCDARKAAATMAVTRHLSRCVGREQRGTGIGPRCSQQARTRFEQLISRIEVHGGCARTGDAAALLDVATRFVEELDQVSRGRTVTPRATAAAEAKSTAAAASPGVARPAPTPAGSPAPAATPHAEATARAGPARSSPAP